MAGVIAIFFYAIPFFWLMSQRNVFALAARS